MDDNERKRREAKKPSNRKFKMSFDIAGRYKNNDVIVLSFLFVYGICILLSN
jgi:hypothetical protein